MIKTNNKGSFKGIGLKLTSIMLVVILLGIFVTQGISVAISADVITGLSLREVDQHTWRKTMEIDGWLVSHESNMATIAMALSTVKDFSEEQQLEIFKAALKQNGKFYYDVYMGYPDGKGVFGGGWQPDPSWLAHERDWYKLALTDAAKPHTTSPYIDAETQEMCITTAAAVNRDGKIAGVVAADILVTTIQEMVLSSNSESGYSTLIDGNGDILVHPHEEFAPDKEGSYRNMAAVRDGAYADLWKKITSSKNSVVRFSDGGGQEKFYTAHALPSTGWYFMTVMPTSVVDKHIASMLLTVIPVALAIMALAAAVIFVIIRRGLSRRISVIADAAGRIASGDLTTAVSVSGNDEIGLLAEAFKHIVESAAEQARVIGKIAEGDLTCGVVPRSERDTLSFALIRMTESTNKQIAVLERLAGGDLTAEIAPRCAADSMSHAIRNTLNNLNGMFREIKAAAERIKAVSDATAESALRLLSGTFASKATVEQLLENIAQITRNASENSNIAGRAADFSGTIKANAETGSRRMDEVIAAVTDINDAGHSITQITKDIDDIAFQTNILAVNAGVEAVRAGDAGRSFAVVAKEVHALARKSAGAAQNAATLIEDAIEKANLGSRIAKDTAASLTDIVSGINECSRLMQDIARHTGEQQKSITEINADIGNVSQVMQHANDNAEKNTSISQEMDKLADALEGLVAMFILRGGD